MADIIRIVRPPDDKSLHLEGAIVSAWCGQWKDLGVLAYLLNLAEGTQFTATELAAGVKDGRYATLTSLRALEQMGFLDRIQHRNNNGQYEGLTYVVRSRPRGVGDA